MKLWIALLLVALGTFPVPQSGLGQPSGGTLFSGDGQILNNTVGHGWVVVIEQKGMSLEGSTTILTLKRIK